MNCILIYSQVVCPVQVTQTHFLNLLVFKNLIIHTCTYIYIHTYTLTCKFIYTYTHIRIYIHTHTHIHVHIHYYIHTSKDTYRRILFYCGSFYCASQIVLFTNCRFCGNSSMNNCIGTIFPKAFSHFMSLCRIW